MLSALLSCKTRDSRNASLNNEDTARIGKLLSKASVTEHPDSALVIANEALELSKKIPDVQWQGKSLMSIVEVYRQEAIKSAADSNASNKLKQNATNAIDSAISLFKTGGYNEYTGDAYLLRSKLMEISDPSVSPAIEQFESKERDEKAALEYYQKAGNKEKQASILADLGKLSLILGNKPKAIEKLQEALAVYEAIHSDQVASTYSLVGAIYANMGNYEQGLKYSYLAVKTAEMNHDTTARMESLYDFNAVVLCHLNQIDKALVYFQKALTVAKKYKDSTYINLVNVNIADAFASLGKYDEALTTLNDIDTSRILDFVKLKIDKTYVQVYLSKGKYDMALPYVGELIAIEPKLEEEDNSHINNLTSIISYYLATKQYKKVYPFTNKYIDHCKKYGNQFELSSGYYWLFQADSNLSNYAAAIKDFETYSSLKDSVFNENKSKQIEEVKTAYEAEKKEQKIQLLTKQSLLKQTRLDKVMLTRNITVAGVLMLSLLLGVSYNRYRLKQRSNRALEAKQQEINNKNAHLESLLKEKEWLIKEIHHRVKNNLQVVVSLLNTQSLYLNDEAAVRAIRESENRMHAMSLIHQRLYQSDDVATISIRTYIRELISYLRDCYDAKVSIVLDEGPDIDLDVAQAIPVGLILNEAISNALKYAFPDERQGKIEVSIKKNEQGTINLKISDNGVGLPADYDACEGGSLGMSLMKGLAEQLGGKLILKNNTGLEIEIEFPYLTPMQIKE